MTPAPRIVLERRTTRLALVLLLLICQTARRAEGHPRRESRHQLTEFAGLGHPVNESGHITTYENRESLRRDQWTRHNNGDATRRHAQRDTSRHQDAPASGFPSALTTSERDAMESARRYAQNREEQTADTSLQSDGKIVFPTDCEMTHQPHNFNPGPPPVCQGITFCENVPHYPTQLVNNALERNNSLRFLASVDMVSDIVQRIDASDETPLCESAEQVIYPRSAENKRKEWLFVLNQENFKQGVRIEICTNEEAKCSVIDGFSEGYRTACKQKYVYRQLAAMGSDGKVISDTFRFPSSCCCHVKFVSDPLLRIGLINERSNQTTSRSRKKK